jgi:hypothetical protein
MLLYSRYTRYQSGPTSWTSKYDWHGMEALEQISVLDYTDEFIFIFYCWTNSGKDFPSFLVYSTIPGAQLTPELENRFQTSLDRSGVVHLAPPLENFCQPDYSPEKCPPESF